MHKPPSSFTFGDVFRALWRNLILIILLSVLGGAGAYYVANSLPETYSATARLISDAGRSGLITVDDQIADETGDATATSTMVETIGTNVVLNHALEQLSPEEMAMLEEAAYPPDQPREEELSEEEHRKGLLRHVSQNFDASNSGRSFVVNIQFNSENPELAAVMANAVAQGYLQYRLEMRNEVYEEMLNNLQSQITELTNGLETAEQTAQTMRERLRLLSQRSDVWAEGRQDEAIAENAELYSRQREAEREVAATAVVYEQLLLEHRQIQSRMGEPEIYVQLFSPAVVPTRPSGFNVKPVILALGVMAGFLLGLSIGMIRANRQRRRAADAAEVTR
ncbi:Chain length determinant protein [Paracoccus isoporae]|uniref:Chain length determinant protein n=1 Tax=Paracoccus isoporae TaxID=591205 RepID=A0A1G7BD00_9RHOB|nr:Wzz/FepE/Etk N-terminal domain-containing protein [Paracoccus isoporae]SDE24115.1 Chain length determinant protein [Paracoccus isoporae]